MNILVVFTGGTIGSAVQDGYISPDRNNKYKLLKQYEMSHAHIMCDVTFSACEPFMMLSENMTCDKVVVLMHTVKEAIASGKYDGIIVCHGTDTLQYSSAALAYMAGLSAIPVMVVSSNYVIEDVRANGMANFAAAVDFILGRCGKGVFIPYQNTGDVMTIHRASRALPHLPVSDDVYSVMNACYGTMELSDGRYVFEKNPAYEEEPDEMEPLCPEQYDAKDSGILQIFPATGMRYPLLTNDGSVKAILHHSYHSGTVCSQSEEFTLFAKKAKELKIPIFLAGANYNTDYESTKVYEEWGIHVLKQTSPIAMYCKLWLCISCGLDPMEYMDKSLAGDIMTK